jgi:hypothetical protein
MIIIDAACRWVYPDGKRGRRNGSGGVASPMLNIKAEEAQGR